MAKKTYIITGMDCASCARMIESDLEDTGVTAVCSYVKQTLTVEFNETKIKEQTIKDVILQAGYQIV